MKKSSREALDAYYHEAGSWAEDRSAALRASRRLAWIIAAVAVVVALMFAIVVIAMLPLKTVVPYTLLVDRHTGYVQALKPLDADKIAPDAALTQSFLVQYVIARESFDVSALQNNYRKVSLWSAGQARADYVSAIQVSNPESPLNRLPRSTTIDVQVESVSPLSDKTALVRFVTERRDASGRAAPLQSWVAVIRYRFSDQPLAMADRFINPVGFQVDHYRRNQEALPVSDAGAADGGLDNPPGNDLPGDARATGIPRADALAPQAAPALRTGPSADRRAYAIPSIPRPSDQR